MMLMLALHQYSASLLGEGAFNQSYRMDKPV